MQANYHFALSSLQVFFFQEIIWVFAGVWYLGLVHHHKLRTCSTSPDSSPLMQFCRLLPLSDIVLLHVYLAVISTPHCPLSPGQTQQHLLVRSYNTVQQSGISASTIFSPLVALALHAVLDSEGFRHKWFITQDWSLSSSWGLWQIEVPVHSVIHWPCDHAVCLSR